MRKIILLLCVLLWQSQAFALSVIRDSEIEFVLTHYVRQIFKAVHLPPENAEIVLINDPSINAFVAGGQTIFVHTGLITSAKSADDLVFVLSHETGHIVGGHITRGMAAMEKAQTTALISTLMGGLLAVVAGRPDAGIAVMVGSQSSAMGTFAGYRQTEESSADRVAVDVVQKLGYSMQGFTNVMKEIQAQERLNANEYQNYLRTHPITQDRRQNLQRFTDKAGPVHQDKKFTRIRAKLAGFLWEPKRVRSTYTSESSDDIYARAIADYRDHQTDKALEALNGLLQKESENAYLYELKGQFEFETGRLSEAVKDYEIAVQKAPEAALIRISLAQSLLERGQKGDAQKALDHLTHATLHEEDSPLVWQLMAKAYDRLKKPAFATCAMAEFYLTSNKKEQALKMAKKALEDLPEESVCAARMHDILDQK